MTIVRPTDGNDTQHPTAIGYVYVNGTEVKVDAIEICLDSEEPTSVIIALPVENLRILSDTDLAEQVEKLIDLGGQRKIFIGRPVIGDADGPFDVNAYDGIVSSYTGKGPGGEDEI